jgi:hypothetical protein
MQMLLLLLLPVLTSRATLNCHAPLPLSEAAGTLLCSLRRAASLLLLLSLLWLL